MQTGSLVNMLMINSTDIEPEIGMGVTILRWTDREPGTIIDMSKNKKTIVIQEDNAVRTDKNGISECQEYEYTPNKNASAVVYTKRKNNKYHKQGQSMSSSPLLIGYRERYYDYSF